MNASHRRQLKQKQRRLARRQRQEAAATASLTAPLTARSAKRELNSATRLKFGDQERQLRGELRVSGAQQGRITDWFGNYERSIDQARGASAAEYAHAEDVSRGVSNPLDSSGGSLAQQAQAARAMANDAYTRRVASDGAAQGSLLGSRRIAATAQELGAHQAEVSRAASVRGDQRTLKAQKGDFRVTYRNQLKDTAKKDQLERIALGVKSQQAASDAKLARQKLKVDQKLAQSLVGDRKTKAKAARQKAREDRKHHRAQETTANVNAAANVERAAKTGTKKKASGPTHSERRAARNQLDQAVSTLQLAGGKNPKNYAVKQGQAKLVNYLVAKKRVPRWIALAAYQKIVYGGVGPKTKHALRHKFGIHERGFDDHQGFGNALNALAGVARGFLG